MDRHALKRAEAAKKLLIRVDGKPTETVKVGTVKEPDSVEEPKTMPREERQARIRKRAADRRLHLVEPG